ncbi:hypothetical protein Taro_030584 [Colocasia esculenta]|uniref:Exostosin GT47 domain-containing protein n=1 Tax=Colocasia esculenta TaxID=4460 RepID=A0A843VWJ8_COLES|nr:hypothetical protein [Colocasia esculenta]
MWAAVAQAKRQSCLMDPTKEERGGGSSLLSSVPPLATGQCTVNSGQQQQMVKGIAHRGKPAKVTEGGICLLACFISLSTPPCYWELIPVESCSIRNPACSRAPEGVRPAVMVPLVLIMRRGGFSQDGLLEVVKSTWVFSSSLTRKGLKADLSIPRVSSQMGESTICIRQLCQARSRRLFLVIGFLASLVVVFQTFTLPSRKVLPPLLPVSEISDTRQNGGSFPGNMRVGKLSLLSDSVNNSLLGKGELVEASVSEVKDKHDNDSRMEDMSEDVEDDEVFDDVDLDGDGDTDDEVSFDLGNGVTLKKIRDPVDGFITLKEIREPDQNATQEKLGGLSILDMRENISNDSMFTQVASAPSISQSVNTHTPEKLETTAATASPGPPLLEKSVPETHARKNDPGISLSFLASVTHNTTLARSVKIKLKKRAMPATSIQEMNSILMKNHASARAMRPRWSSAHDRQILAVKAQIENAPIVMHDQELYAPAFRNISKFKRSYELMERTLKVFVYKEGKKPVFHQPIMKGIYASEGWFMKHMEGNRRFVVKDPRKAHLFYMPFSSRFLQFAVYVRGSHNRTNLREYLRNYVDVIAAKYPFWNRTGGADHFLVACHDWAPYETRHTMERSIKALCNADLANGFRLGKDVSLPETYVRSARDPRRDLGGRPSDRRPVLAFYAGNMHGYLRPVLLQHWENKDPDMNIRGPMPPGVSSKMSYIQQMKRSKYCICPRGYEVNSPRVVEAIFYECVPVIISDNYVPPFFEVLEWEAFSVFVAEKDIPRLKEILTSIPEERYRALQMGVRKVQRHFLWHSPPLKYDLFHMTLHSIWYNRVYQVRTR